MDGELRDRRGLELTLVHEIGATRCLKVTSIRLFGLLGATTSQPSLPTDCFVPRDWRPGMRFFCSLADRRRPSYRGSASPWPPSTRQSCWPCILWAIVYGGDSFTRAATRPTARHHGHRRTGGLVSLSRRLGQRGIYWGLKDLPGCDARNCVRPSLVFAAVISCATCRLSSLDVAVLAGSRRRRACGLRAAYEDSPFVPRHLSDLGGAACWIWEKRGTRRWLPCLPIGCRPALLWPADWIDRLASICFSCGGDSFNLARYDGHRSGCLVSDGNLTADT